MINSYITDMLSLEEHIEKGLWGEVKNFKVFQKHKGNLEEIKGSTTSPISESSASAATPDSCRRPTGAPGAVIRFLREEGLPVREDVLPEISRTIETVWHAQSAQAPRADETAVAQNR